MRPLSCLDYSNFSDVSDSTSKNTSSVSCHNPPVRLSKNSQVYTGIGEETWKKNTTMKTLLGVLLFR